MNSTKISLKASALLVAALSALSMQAHAGDESTYRRSVLGQSETFSQPAAQEAPAVSKLVPGSHARYLMVVNGKSEAEALAQARRAGEEPTWQTSVPAREVALNGHERYQRAMGVSTVRKSGT